MIEDNLRNAIDSHEREVWRTAKERHRKYVRKSALKKPFRSQKNIQRITSSLYFPVIVPFCRCSCSEVCTCTAALTAHTRTIACTRSLMALIKLLSDCHTSIRTTKLHQKAWNTRWVWQTSVLPVLTRTGAEIKILTAHHSLLLPDKVIRRYYPRCGDECLPVLGIYAGGH